MGDLAAIGLWLVLAYVLFWVLLAFIRRIYRASFLTSTWLLLTSLLLALGTIAAGYLAMLAAGALNRSAGDAGLGGILLTGVLGVILGLGTVYLLCQLALRRTTATAPQRWQISLTTLLLLPVALALVWGGVSLYHRVPHLLNDASQTALAVQGTQAQALAVEYRLPLIHGASYHEFHRNGLGIEHYSTRLQPYSGWQGESVAWQEWPEQIAHQAEAGLKAAGYRVERSTGQVRKIDTHPGTVELADIVVTGTLDGRCVRYVIQHAWGEQVATPEVLVEFGDVDSFSKVLPQSL